MVAVGDYERDGELLAAWSEFCEQVRQAGEQVCKDFNGSSEVERCSGFQYLTQNLSQAFDIFLENRQTGHPFLHAFDSPIRKLGGDDADCTYYQAWINDHDTYRVYGRKGTARMFNIALQGPWQGYLPEPFGDFPIANIFGSDLNLDEEGNFELWVSPEPHDGNWVESKPGVRKLFFRQYFDRWDEEPGSFRIERVGPLSPPDPLGTDTLLEAMSKAGTFVFETLRAWPDNIWNRNRPQEHINSFARNPAIGRSQNTDSEATSEMTDTRRGRIISSMVWRLEPDEAMIIEFQLPDDAFWQVTNMNIFHASMDFRYRQVNLTSGTAERDNDGMGRLIMTHDDPGYANWIDTQQHHQGWMLFRTVFTLEEPDFTVRIIPRASLDKELNGTARKITPEERQNALQKRLDAYARRFPTLGV
jgi:hypothetical protein